MRMAWPFRAEHRDASATDAIVDALIAQAAGSSVPPLVEALGRRRDRGGTVGPVLGVGNDRALYSGNRSPYAVRDGIYRARAGRSR